MSGAISTLGDYDYTYAYDEIGNMTTHPVSGALLYTDASNPHALTTAGLDSWTYDANGNVLTTPDLTLAWNYRDELSSSTAGADKTSYIYDYSGTRRVKTDSSGNVTRYIGSYVYNIGDGSQEWNVSLLGNPVFLAKDDGSSVNYEWIHTDHLGSTSVVTDEDGMMIELLDYNPYGTERISWSSSSESGEAESQKTYIGEYSDNEIGLSYLNARYYDPERGQFISQDPWEGDYSDPQSLNKYSYARDNPIKYVDTSGEWFETAFDILMFGLSYNDFTNDPGLGTGFGLIADSVSLILPIPALYGGIKHADDAVQFLGGLNRVDNVVDTAKGIINIPSGSNLRFSQTSINGVFDSGGAFQGATRESVIQGLKNGTIDPSSIQINYLERDGYRIVENNRSAGTLIEAGIPETRWNLKPIDSDTDAIGRLDDHLSRNGLSSIGTDSVTYKK